MRILATVKPALGFAATAAAVAAVTAAIGVVLTWHHIANISMLYLVVVLVAAVGYGRLQAIFASIISVVAFNWFFIEPLHTLSVTDPEEWLALLLFLVVAVVTGQLAAGQRRRAEEALRREQEAELLRAREEVRQAVLASVSHDLRTPLASIKGAAESLAQRTIHWSEEQQQAFASAIVLESSRLSRLVDNLLDMSRIEAGRLHPDIGWYPLDSLMDDVLSRLDGVTADHVVHVDVPESIPPVPLDYVQIGEALANLIENAVKYTPAGSQIDVMARVERGGVRVAVRDNGPGLPPEALPHVFEKFYRVSGGDRASIKGIGLGLAVARGYVEAHGGAISAVSPPPGAVRGSEFSFWLPLRPPGVTGPQAQTPSDVAVDARQAGSAAVPAH